MRTLFTDYSQVMNKAGKWKEEKRSGQIPRFPEVASERRKPLGGHPNRDTNGDVSGGPQDTQTSQTLAAQPARLLRWVAKQRQTSRALIDCNEYKRRRPRQA